MATLEWLVQTKKEVLENIRDNPDSNFQVQSVRASYAEGEVLALNSLKYRSEEETPKTLKKDAETELKERLSSYEEDRNEKYPDDKDDSEEADEQRDTAIEELKGRINVLNDVEKYVPEWQNAYAGEASVVIDLFKPNGEFAETVEIELKVDNKNLIEQNRKTLVEKIEQLPQHLNLNAFVRLNKEAENVIGNVPKVVFSANSKDN